MEKYENFDASKEKVVQIAIPASELEVHGVRRGEFSSPIAVLAPGLGGWMHDLLLFNAARYFEQHGISTLRVSFYGDDERQRDIGDFDVKVAAADIDAIVGYLRRHGAEWICVIGHSYSGMAIVYSQEQAFDAAVLWDASHTDGYGEPQAVRNLVQDFTYSAELDCYVSASGPGYVISRSVFEDYAPGSTVMAQNFDVDTLVVNAEKSGDVMLRFGADYASSISADTEHVVVEGASHPFTEDGAMEKLFEVTAEWLKQKAGQAGCRKVAYDT